MRRESSFQVTFNHYLKNVYKKTAAFELKQTLTDSIPFSAVKDHQIAALMAVKYGTFVFKIPDAGYQNPFDCFSMTMEAAYIVIKYPSFFCMIDVESFLLERDVLSKRKSLTADRAKQIASWVI